MEQLRLHHGRQYQLLYDRSEVRNSYDFWEDGRSGGYEQVLDNSKKYGMLAYARHLCLRDTSHVTDNTTQLGRVVEFHTVFRGRFCVVHVRIQIRRSAIRFGLSSRRWSMISAIKKVRAIAITEDKAADSHLSKVSSISPVTNMKSTPSLTISFITLCLCLSMRASTSPSVM